MVPIVFLQMTIFNLVLDATFFFADAYIGKRYYDTGRIGEDASYECLEAIRRSTMGMGAATRHAGCRGSTEGLMKKSPSTTPPVPTRSNAVLSEEQIRMSLYVLRLVLIEKEEFKIVSTAEPFHRAAYYTGISHMTLRDLWEKFLASQGTSSPLPTPQKKKERMKKVSSAWCGPIRAEIRRIHLEKGHAVEIPMLQKWLREEHNTIVTKKEMHYRLQKMGFVFGTPIWTQTCSASGWKR